MVIRAHAPVRIADIGGWTDTWFAKTGLVCNLAVSPGVSVTITDTSPTEPTVLHLADFGESYAWTSLGQTDLTRRHGLLHSCLSLHLRRDTGLSIAISSAVPAGSSLGTSAAVGVALIGALRCANGESFEPAEIARLAHQAETAAGFHSGVQDHAAAAHGGVCQIEVDYPAFRTQRLSVDSQTVDELNRRLRTVYLGRPHDSSALHAMVIERLVADGRTGGSAVYELDQLRDAAACAVEALLHGDLAAYGRCFDRTVDAQRALHPKLISADADAIQGVCSDLGGHIKVNGAGGPGGSLTILGPSDAGRLEQLDERLAALAHTKVLGVRLSNLGLVIESKT